MSIDKYTRTGGINPIYAAIECQKAEDDRFLSLINAVQDIQCKTIEREYDYNDEIESYKKQVDIYIDGLERENELLKERLEIKMDFLMRHSNSKEELILARKVLKDVD